MAEDETYKNGSGRIAKIAAVPIYDKKNLQNLRLWNQRANIDYRKVPNAKLGL